MSCSCYVGCLLHGDISVFGVGVTARARRDASGCHGRHSLLHRAEVRTPSRLDCKSSPEVGCDFTNANHNQAIVLLHAFLMVDRFGVRRQCRSSTRLGRAGEQSSQWLLSIDSTTTATGFTNLHTIK